MSELIQVLRKFRVWLWVLAIQGVAVLLLRVSIGSSVSGGMKGYVWGGGEQFLAGLFELMSGGGGFLKYFPILSAVALLITLGVWWISLGGVIAALRQSSSLSSLAAVGLRSAGGLIGVTLWHIPIRLVLVVLPFVALSKAFEHGIPLPFLLVILALLCFCSFTLDLARCRVVFALQSGWHPRATISAFRDACRRPRVFAKSALWGALQWAALIAIAWATLNHAGTGSLTLWARCLAVAGTLFGLCRLAVAVNAWSPGSEGFPGSPEVSTQAFQKPEEESEDAVDPSSEAEPEPDSFPEPDAYGDQNEPIEASSETPGAPSPRDSSPSNPTEDTTEPRDGSQPETEK